MELDFEWASIGWRCRGQFAYMDIKSLNIEASNLKTVWCRCGNDPRSVIK